MSTHELARYFIPRKQCAVIFFTTTSTKSGFSFQISLFLAVQRNHVVAILVEAILFVYYEPIKCWASSTRSITEATPSSAHPRQQYILRQTLVAKGRWIKMFSVDSWPPKHIKCSSEPTCTQWARRPSLLKRKSIKPHLPTETPKF